MKRNTMIVTAAAIALAGVAGIALADGKRMGDDMGMGMGGMGMRGMGMGGPRGMGPAMMLNFAEIDSDGNGNVTQAEIEAFGKARFDAADTNGDGKLSADELTAAAQKRAEEARARRAGMMATRMLDRLDDDNDGTLSFDEMPGRKPGAQKMFERLDNNNDGVVSQDEFQTARARMDEHRGEGRNMGEGRHMGEGHRGKHCDD